MLTLITCVGVVFVVFLPCEVALLYLPVCPMDFGRMAKCVPHFKELGVKLHLKFLHTN